MYLSLAANGKSRQNSKMSYPAWQLPGITQVCRYRSISFEDYIQSTSTIAGIHAAGVTAAVEEGPDHKLCIARLQSLPCTRDVGKLTSYTHDKCQQCCRKDAGNGKCEIRHGRSVQNSSL